MKKTALFTLIMGILTLLSFLLFIIKMGGEVRPWQYPNPQGFKAAMVWFELADNAEEIFANLGPADDLKGKEIRMRMDTGNTYDVIFMPCYSIFFVAIILYIIKALQQKGMRHSFDRIVQWLVCACALGMWVGDIFENKQLLMLTSFTSIQDVPANILVSLKLWTTIKWGLIFFCSAAAAVYYARYFSLRRPSGIIFVLLYAASALSGALGLFISRFRPVIEMTNTIIAIAWLMSMVHAGILAFSRNPENA